ncbi:hypothetical protein CARUB_v10007075mg [Capsella rubella]|uniref:F-box domain-containing protein n=1 Tax=Capsella rubella TaxID=81985 RepID=R0F9A8_9BRAS|nr:putative F-box protein At4g22180 [Capsella rubella]EOA18522.1 hypothetical protein CARUB_v10007075mg [Capsella rubella]
MENKHNPNCHECLRGDASSCWSDLPQDLLISVLERLGFTDFQRAKSVCSSWYAASRNVLSKNNQIPWLILFPEDNNNNSSSCTLFNPEEKHKLYKTDDLGVKFPKSVCIATYGSWLLMQDPRYNLYLLNLFTHERIDLPPVESQLGTIKVERVLDNWFLASDDHYTSKVKGITMRSPVIWIDEKTKDYVVLWGLWNCSVVYAKKGDTSWNQVPEISSCLHMVYKDHKLYFSSSKNIFTIFDFSGEIPQQTFQCVMQLFRFVLGHRRRSARPSNEWFVDETKLVVTVAGDVFKVQRMIRPRSGIISFRVYKVYSSLGIPKYEPVDSLGDEAMLLDLGVTVLVNEVDGLHRNSIYFSGSHGKKKKDIFIFNLETRKMKSLQKLDCSSVQLSRARWFLPSFTPT